MKFTFTDVVVSIAMGFMVLVIYGSSLQNAHAIEEMSVEETEVVEVIIDASNREYFHPCDSQESYAAYLAQERNISVFDAEDKAWLFFTAMKEVMQAQYSLAGIEVTAEQLDILASGACFVSYSDYEVKQ